MPKLSDVLYAAEQAALATRQPQHIKLAGGLTIIVDYSAPAAHQVRIGRPAPIWPSATELSTIRRYITIPPGADLERGERNGWNVVCYKWRATVPVCK